MTSTKIQAPSIETIVEIAIKTLEGQELTGYQVHNVINAIHQIVDRPQIAPQEIYNRIKSFMKIKSMSGVRLNSDQVREFVIAYLSGKAKTSQKNLADLISADLAKLTETTK